MKALAAASHLRVVSKLRPEAKTPPLAVASKPRITAGRIDTYNSHPAVGLTADMLLAQYREAERGQPLKQFDTFDDLIEIDGHLRGLINGRIDAVSACDWVIRPGRDDKPSRIAAEALDDHLRNRVAFEEFIEHHLAAPHYGVAATNIVWDQLDGIVAPAELIHAPPRRLASPSQDQAHEVWLVAGATGNELHPLLPGLWSVSRYRSRNPWAAGLMRTAAWWAMFKRWSIRDWQVFAEMFGLPLVIGFYDEAAGAATREALEEAVKAIGEDGFAVLSDLAEIVIKDTARSGDSSTVYPKIAALCEAQMSKLIAGSTTASDVGGDVGSYNLGAIHESRAYKLSLSDARLVQKATKRDIATWFNRFNGFDQAAPASLKIQITRDSLDRAKALQIIGSIVPLDPDQLYEEFTLRRPAEGAGVMMPVKVPAGGGDGAE